MNTFRYVSLFFLILFPALAFAQQPSDSVVVFAGDTVAPGRTAQFGAQFSEGERVGPLPLVAAEPLSACAATGPLFNADELEGNIALIRRGDCFFAEKIQQVAEAGAVAAVVFNHDPSSGQGEDGITPMWGECTVQEGCSIPAAFVSYNSGQSLLAEAGQRAIIEPVRIEPIVPPPSTVFTHNTGNVVFDVYEYGFLGQYVDSGGNGFTFEGDNDLRVSTVLIGRSGFVVSNPYVAQSEFDSESVVEVLEVPFPSPFEDFDEGAVTSFSSTNLGVLVTERSYSREGDSYVIVELEVQNVSGSDIEEAYVGILADWDVGDDTSQNDLGRVNEDLNVPYVYDADMDQYYGVAAWGAGDLSGYSLDATIANDAQLWEAMTTEVAPVEGPTERVAVTGTGPYSIATGTSVVVRFAFVGGASEAEFFEHVMHAIYDPLDASASTPEDGFALAPIYPNPTASHATVSLDLPTAQEARVAVFDVLGRRVAVLHDGPLAAGQHRLAFDGSTLPAGLYVVRAMGVGPASTQRVTVVR